MEWDFKFHVPFLLDFYMYLAEKSRKLTLLVSFSKFALVHTHTDFNNLVQNASESSCLATESD